MDQTVPPGAALLLDFIGKIETGKEGREGYDVIYSNAQGRLPKPITQMTIAQLQAHQGSGWPAKSTAAGRYQFMRKTLAGLRSELGLRDGQVFDPNLQDRLGYHLLKRRGYAAFVAGEIGATEFGKRLAMEWASLPVLADTQGGSRQVKRGQSYYAGDGLNKALVSPEQVEELLAGVRNAVAWTPPPPDAPTYPEAPPITSDPGGNVSLIVILFVLAILVAIGGAIAQLTNLI